MAVDQVETADNEELEAQEVITAVNDGTLEVDEDVDIDDPAELKKLVKKLRRENAAKRVKGKEIEDAAQQWKKHLDAQKTELEKAQERAKELEAEIELARIEKLQHLIAKEFELDEDLEEFITGADEKEMRKKAEKLAEKAVSKPASSASDLSAGRRGAHLAPKRGEGGKFLESLVTY